jgi:hypothetical protein
MLPELLAQQVFKQEAHDSLLRVPGMDCVHIGGEELLFGGNGGAPAANGTVSGGPTGFANMFDD